MIYELISLSTKHIVMLHFNCSTRICRFDVHAYSKEVCLKSKADDDDVDILEIFSCEHLASLGALKD